MTFDLDKLTVPNLWLRPKEPQVPGGACGTISPCEDGNEVAKAVREGVRRRTGRRVYEPADTVEGALVDVEGYCVVPEWYDNAAELAREVLRALYEIEAADDVQRWAIYAEAARRLGVPGMVPVPTKDTGGG